MRPGTKYPTPHFQVERSGHWTADGSKFWAICLPQKSFLENHQKSLSDIASLANLRINNVSRGSLALCPRPTRAPLSLSEAGEGNPYCVSVASGLTSRIPYSQLELGRVRGVEKAAVLFRGCSRMRQPKPFARLGSPCQRSEPYWGRGGWGRGSLSGSLLRVDDGAWAPRGRAAHCSNR